MGIKYWPGEKSVKEYCHIFMECDTVEELTHVYSRLRKAGVTRYAPLNIFYAKINKHLRVRLKSLDHLELYTNIVTAAEISR